MSKFNFFTEVEVSTNNFENHTVAWDFNSAGLLLLNESTKSEDIIEYSFTGSEVHGNLKPNKPSAGISFDNRHESRIWFRRTGQGVIRVRVEAWA